ncbi:hypothetical protein ACFYPC_26600 [Streptomyces sp. NPDC005808]|uniref:hypothetical protein n=1 Tax=Streptomyces sp. NPDC005808 TaxID=3364734 RepID=UPI0036959890
MRDPRGTGDAAAQRRNFADVEGGGPGAEEVAAVVPALLTVSAVPVVSDVSAVATTSSGSATA